MNLAVKNVAERLGVSSQTVYVLCRVGKLRHTRFGIGRGTIRVSEQDLDAFIARCQEESAPTIVNTSPPIEAAS